MEKAEAGDVALAQDVQMREDQGGRSVISVLRKLFKQIWSDGFDRLKGALVHAAYVTKL